MEVNVLRARAQKWTVFLAVTGILGITAWIGYTLFNSPSVEMGLDVEEE